VDDLALILTFSTRSTANGSGKSSATRARPSVLKTDADEGYYIVTRYDDLRTVLEDAETYSSVQAGLRGVPIKMPPLTEDPPRHIEYRRALNKYLSRSFLAKYADDIRDTARTLLAEHVPGGHFDFMTDYAIPLPHATWRRSSWTTATRAHRAGHQHRDADQQRGRPAGLLRHVGAGRGAPARAAASAASATTCCRPS